MRRLTIAVAAENGQMHTADWVDCFDGIELSEHTAPTQVPQPAMPQSDPVPPAAVEQLQQLQQPEEDSLAG